MKKLTFSIFSLFLLSGCAMTPYKSDFTKCPNVDSGKCGSITNAYIDALRTPATEIPKASTIKQAVPVVSAEQKKPEENTLALASSQITSPPALNKERVFEEYQVQRMRKESKLLRDPQTPLVTPATVMRVLFRPYKGDNGELNMARFTYVIVEEPQFIVGDEIDESGADGGE